MTRTRVGNIYKLLLVTALWVIAGSLGVMAFTGQAEPNKPFVFDYPVTQAPAVDGKNGVNGLDGKNGVKGKDGLDGKDGADCLPTTKVVDGVIIEYQSEYTEGTK
jgi:hypothetical protein